MLNQDGAASCMYVFMAAGWTPARWTDLAVSAIWAEEVDSVLRAALAADAARRGPTV